MVLSEPEARFAIWEIKIKKVPVPFFNPLDFYVNKDII
jgi:hypothetical protein